MQVVSSVPGSLAVFLIPHTNASLKQAAKDWCAGGERKEAVKRRFGPIEEWEVSEVTYMYGLFKDQAEFNENISKWSVGKVESMNSTFENATSFNCDLSGWEVSNVESMSKTFAGATSFNCDLSGWDVSKVWDMSFTFDGATSFNQTLSGAWYTSNAYQVAMFYNCPGSILNVRRNDQRFLGIQEKPHSWG